MRTYVRCVLRRAPSALRLLVPRRRLDARRDRAGRAGAGLRHPRADRPQLAVGRDGVRPGGQGHRATTAVRSRDRRDRCGRAQGRGAAAPPDAAGARRAGLAQPVPPADARPRRHARTGQGGLRARSVGDAGGRRRARRGARLPERLRGARRARRADDAPAAGGVRARVLPRRAAAPVRAPRSRAQPWPGVAGAAAGRPLRGHRQRARAHPRARATAGRVRGHPRAHHARRLRAAAAGQPRARARLAGGDGGALRGPPRGGRRDAAAGRDADLRPDARTSATATPTPTTTTPTSAWPSCAWSGARSATRTGTRCAATPRRASTRSCA